MVHFAGSVAMSSVVVLLLMFASFVAGFWLGVNTYREQLKKQL